MAIRSSCATIHRVLDSPKSLITSLTIDFMKARFSRSSASQLMFSLFLKGWLKRLLHEHDGWLQQVIDVVLMTSVQSSSFEKEKKKKPSQFYLIVLDPASVHNRSTVLRMQMSVQHEVALY